MFSVRFGQYAEEALDVFCGGVDAPAYSDVLKTDALPVAGFNAAAAPAPYGVCGRTGRGEFCGLAEGDVGMLHFQYLQTIHCLKILCRNSRTFTGHYAANLDIIRPGVVEGAYLGLRR